MSNKILFVSATKLEAKPIIKKLKKLNENFYTSTNADLLITGIGTIYSIFNLTKFLSSNKDVYSKIVNFGICGSFSTGINIGDIVEVKQDIFADFGINDNGIFKTIFESKLIDKNTAPFHNGQIIFDEITNLQKVKSITVNTSSGNTPDINKLINKFAPQIETMEGAAIGFTSKLFNIKVSQIRAVSNKVEARNKKNWNINLAIQNINNFLINDIYTQSI